MDPNDPSYDDLARKHKILREDSPISQILPSLQRIYGASLEMPRIFLPPCPKSLAIFDHHCCRFHILFQFITRRYKWETRKVKIVSHLYNIFEIITGSSIQSHPKSWRQGSDTQFTGFFKPTPKLPKESTVLRISRKSWKARGKSLKKLKKQSSNMSGRSMLIPLTCGQWCLTNGLGGRSATQGDLSGTLPRMEDVFWPTTM